MGTRFLEQFVLDFIFLCVYLFLYFFWHWHIPSGKSWTNSFMAFPKTVASRLLQLEVANHIYYQKQTINWKPPVRKDVSKLLIKIGSLSSGLWSLSQSFENESSYFYSLSLILLFIILFFFFWNNRYNWPVRTHHSFPGWNDFCR